MRSAPLLVIIILLCAGAVSAATITGTAYDLELRELNDTIFELRNAETGQAQRYVSKDGTYAFDAPPGAYQLIATQAGLASVDPLIITDETAIVHDIIILDDLSDLDDLITETEEQLLADADLQEAGIPPWMIPTLIVIGIILLAAIAALIVRRKTSAKNEPDLRMDEPDLKAQVLQFIEKEGGRTTQKTIRRQFAYSEAKISLVLSELEHEKKIRKIKKGRSNIITKNE